MYEDFTEKDQMVLKFMQQGWSINTLLVHEIYESKKKYREWDNKLPFLKFDPTWQIKIIPPYCNALIRFRVKKQNAHVSIYFDTDNSLGYMNAPYWEIYPYYDKDENGEYQEDTNRFLFGEEGKMLIAIGESLEYQIKNKDKL
jgi:hypothetical protein